MLAAEADFHGHAIVLSLLSAFLSFSVLANLSLPHICLLNWLMLGAAFRLISFQAACEKSHRMQLMVMNANILLLVMACCICTELLKSQPTHDITLLLD